MTRMRFTNGYNYDSANRVLSVRDLDQILDVETDMGFAFSEAIDAYIDDAIEGLEQGFNVKTYGAVGDGVADDTLAIQAALDAAGAIGVSGVVFFPGGTYKITATLDLPGGVLLQGTGSHNTGSRPGSFINAEGVASGPALEAGVSSMWHHGGISRLRVYGCPGDGISIDGSGWGENSVIDQVMVTSCGGDGISVNGSSTPITMGRLSVHSNGGTGIRLVGQSHTHVQIMYVAGDNNGESLVTIEGLSTVGSVRILGWKSERWSATPGNPVVFLITDGNGGLVDLGQGRVHIGAAVAIGDAVVKQTAGGGSSVARVKFAYTLNDSSGTGGYTYGYSDTKNSVTNTVTETARKQCVYGFPNLYGRLSNSFAQVGELPTGPAIYFGTANPEAGLTAEPGSVVFRSNGSVYIKRSGSGNTGWLVMPYSDIDNTWVGNQTVQGHLKLLSMVLGGGIKMGAGNDEKWEQTVAGTGTNSLYFRYTEAAADERWMYFSKHGTVGAGVDTIQMRPGGVTMLDLTTTKAVLHGPAQLDSVTTAGRPSAVTSGEGAIIYDTDLNTPIYSDGAVWRKFSDDTAA